MRRGIRELKLPRVHRVTKPSGAVFKYHTRTRAKLPADIPEEDPAFIEAWAAEERKAPRKGSRATAGTVAAACEAFLASRTYLDLKPAYRSIIRRHVEAIKAKTAKAMIADLAPRHISLDLEALSPAVASARIKAWRKMSGFWAAKGLTATDIAASVKRKAMPQTDGHIAWTDADVAVFRARWPIGTEQRRAFEMLQWTGARCVDVVRLGPQNVGPDGVLSYVQSKTGKPAHVPWTCQAFGLEDQRADLLSCVKGTNALIYVITAYGKPRSPKGFSQWFSAAAKAAGLPHKTAHGLRKYRMIQMAENGLSILIMQAWVGHTTMDEVEEYTRQANRRRTIAGTQSLNRSVNQ
ncbi:tyrosine-type recombinase/integrase [Ralstonia sp.]|uniref:tyrosine-type recombinase/integrase n=1 Tax=Ralstonia sp. TaxID=54061 RepID=UPI00257C670F|nr:tyrosine-type recombinase/integrase [Ralstonia sp.]MBA4282016.1 recombinase [Ralstonia sp.]